MNPSYDVIIIGAGAAGLMAAATAGKRGRSVLLLDHAKKIGEKIRISGGGRCNFTNIHTSPANYLSNNPHFCKSALKQYTQFDFIDLVQRHGIKFHEKKLGQLFCDDSAQNIIDMLLAECEDGRVNLKTGIEVLQISSGDSGYAVATQSGIYPCKSLIIASGGLSIPKIGASKFGYDIARQFGLNVIETRAGLVPLTFTDSMLDRCKGLSGISVEASVTAQDHTRFAEGLLFTHRGLSGPSILQISSYWKEGQELSVNLANGYTALDALKSKRQSSPKQDIKKTLSEIIPARLAEDICENLNLSGHIADQSDKKLGILAAAINDWRVKPAVTEGYRTAEVTLGGVNTDALSSKTMECKAQKGLYFIGEVVDVTGHLGGFNFQWAWSSGSVAGMNV